MRFLGVIPARYGSTRLPAKPLINISGRPLLQWVIEGAQKSEKLNELIVATDHAEIAALAEKLGVQAIMTASELPSGSDRVWAAVQEREADVILNIQGDEPLLQGQWIDQLIEPFLSESDLKMATVAHAIDPRELNQVSAVKVILNQNSDGIYFSRHAIPYTRQTFEESPHLCLKHIGLYAYKKSFLKKFCQTPPTALERAESLEQLRALYLGERIKVMPIDALSIGVDTPDDVKAVSKILNQGV
jgi:3-deoxy-manno-octulosonate cytidylyltransferase (CMP-KDO synthetase)